MIQTANARRAFLLVFFLVVLFLVRDFLVPVAMGAIFAVVLHPLMTWNWGSRFSVNLKAFLITSLFMLIILLPAGILFAVGANQAIDLISFVQQKLQSGTDANSSSTLFNTLGVSRLLDWLNQWTPVSEQQFHDVFIKVAKSAGVTASEVLTNFLADLPGFLVTCFVIVVAIFFFIRDGKRMLGFIRRNSVYGSTDTEVLLRSASDLCKSSVNAAIVTGAAQSAVILLSAVICQMSISSLALIGLTAFVSSFVPLVGTAPLMLGLTAYGFIAGPPWHGVVFLVFLGLSGVTDNFVRPLVLGGGEGELHPLVAFVSAFAGLAALGFFGLFIGPVVVGLFFVLITLHDSVEASRA